KFDINDIYTPSSIQRASHKDTQAQAMPIKVFMAFLYRGVLIGDPGGGKSTFCQKLCYDLATASERLVGQRKLIPILVVLRDYGAAKKHHPCSLLEFIEQT